MGKSWPMVRESDCNPKVAGSSLGPAGIVGGGSECPDVTFLVCICVPLVFSVLDFLFVVWFLDS